MGGKCKGGGGRGLGNQELKTVPDLPAGRPRDHKCLPGADLIPIDDSQNADNTVITLCIAPPVRCPPNRADAGTNS